MFWRVAPDPYPAYSWAEGYQSCPLWQTAEKFSWVRPSEGRRGRRAGREGLGEEGSGRWRKAGKGRSGCVWGRLMSGERES